MLAAVAQRGLAVGNYSAVWDVNKISTTSRVPCQMLCSMCCASRASLHHQKKRRGQAKSVDNCHLYRKTRRSTRMHQFRCSMRLKSRITKALFVQLVLMFLKPECSLRWRPRHEPKIIAWLQEHQLGTVTSSQPPIEQVLLPHHVLMPLD